VIGLDNEDENKENTYLLFSCNKWKTHNSMKLIASTDNLQKLKSLISKEIEFGNMEYKKSNSKIENQDVTEINNCLKYGYIEVLKYELL
jgi:hypothetical protein